MSPINWIASHKTSRDVIMTDLGCRTANCTFTFAPVLGLGTFAILAKVNNTEALTEGMAFAVLSLFNLQDRPVMSLLHGFEDFQTIYNAFYRIQTYLLSAEREDSRATPLYQQPEALSDESLPKISTTVASGHGVLTKVIDNNSETSDSETSVIRLTEASGGYIPETMILEGINLGISGGKVTMIVGPVGSGKSTLLRLLLGELPQVSGSVVSDFSKCAYAPQSPWITWGTVRSNILGMSPWDAGWYHKVVRACSLDGDFESLPDGDQTKTGIRGSHLSGGQQIRVVSNVSF